MRNILKIVATDILGVILFQVGSYFLYGKRDIEVCYYKNFTPLLYGIERLHIYSTADLMTCEKQEIKQILEPKYTIDEFSNENMQLDRADNKTVTLQIKVNYDFPFRAVVYENVRTATYLEVWKSEFCWLLGKWVLVEKVNVGQS